MMDAGSTGTRIYVYTWPRRTSEAVPKVVEVGEMSTKPGLSSFPANPNGSREQSAPAHARLLFGGTPWA